MAACIGLANLALKGWRFLEIKELISIWGTYESVHFHMAPSSATVLEFPFQGGQKIKTRNFKVMQIWVVSLFPRLIAMGSWASHLPSQSFFTEKRDN